MQDELASLLDRLACIEPSRPFVRLLLKKISTTGNIDRLLEP